MSRRVITGFLSLWAFGLCACGDSTPALDPVNASDAQGGTSPPSDTRVTPDADVVHHDVVGTADTSTLDAGASDTRAEVSATDLSARELPETQDATSADTLDAASHSTDTSETDSSELDTTGDSKIPFPIDTHGQSDTSPSPDAGLDDVGDEPGPSPPVAGWRLTFVDDFDGPTTPDDPCYDQAQTPAMCMDRYWSHIPCPADVHAQLEGLNKCVWSVYDIYNWMDWEKPFGTGINKLDRRSVRVEGGELVLNATLNPDHGASGCGVELADGKVSHDCPLHSGAVTSKAFTNPGFQQAYGRWEVRARLPAGPGAWPAHWLLPQSGGWPHAGEIDIMEAVASKPNAVHGSFHGGTFTDEVRTHHSVHYWHDPEDARVTDGYHVYAVEWGPEVLRFFVDDLQIGVLHEGTLMETTVLSAPDESLEGSSVGLLPAQVPDVAFHWILNTSLVPTGGLAQDFSNFVPMSHRIDWVKVYEACTSDEQGCIPKAPASARVTEDASLSAELWSADTRVAHVGDFNGDSLDDLLLRARTPEAKSYWLAGTPSADAFATAVEVTSASGMTAALWADSYRDLLVGDFDGDGAHDALMPPRSPGHAAYHLRGGAAPFHTYSVVTDSWGMSYARWSHASRQAYAADVTGDGRDDVLLVGRSASDASYLLEALAEGGFALPIALGESSALSAAQWSLDGHDTVIGDFNGDGSADVLLQGRSDGVSTWLMLATGAGTFEALDVTATPWMNASKWSAQWRQAHVGDFDGDGHADLLLQTRSPGHATYLLLADGFGGFAPEQNLTDSYGLNESGWSAQQRQLLVGDVDGDGADDLILVGTSAEADSYLLRADGQGGFNPVQDITNRHMLSAGLWSTARHALQLGHFKGAEWEQVIVQGQDAEEDSFWVDLRAPLPGSP